ncbi:MAG: PD-(D/E)XK nuclease family protein [Bacteroidota bacterium]
MMESQTFISELAARILEENRSNLARVTVIFPNRRAGLFFRKALGQLIDKPIRTPRVSSMEDFVMQFSPYRKIETLEAVFQLYEVYKNHQKKEETFDTFFFWGEMILRDFEEIDQYLVNTQQLFTSIKTQKELDEEFYFLDEEDRAVIQAFWSSFLPKATGTQEAFLETWKILLPLYESFKQSLEKKNLAYGGMIYREVAEHTDSIKSWGGAPVYFAGFNALTHAEEKIISYFVHEHRADVSWDLDDYYFSNEKQEAGFFLREYARDLELGKTFPKEIPNRFHDSKSFESIGVSLEVGQTKVLSEKLDQLAVDPAYSPDKTVVVLPHEHMLFPTLHAIPDAIDKVNITMGYPLKDTPVFSLLESVLNLQKLRKEGVVNGVSFYYKPLVSLLEHPLLFALEEERIKQLISDIKKRNLIMIFQEELELKHPIFKSIFQKPDQALQYMMEILKGLYETWKEKGHDLELEFISQYYHHVQQLDEMIGDRTANLSYEFLIKLFRRLSRSLKIPFTGEPLNGLQIMGILETRNLDFENVFILNMNEDSWPAAARRGSFIPYNIRKAFNLPTFDHQDAIYAYLFYRLIQRAKRVTFFYNTVSEFNVNGELSRLVQQLETESDYQIQKKILSNPIKTTAPDPIVIEKNGLIRRKMERFLDGYKEKDASRFTPSALNAYLDCKLRFYFKYVEKLYEPDEVQEEMDPMVFGNILHNSMEMLYKQFIRREKREIIYPEDIFWIREMVPGVLNKTFIEHYGIKNEKKFKLEGRSLIAAEVLKKFIYKILDYDKDYAPFKIIGLEASSRDGYALDIPILIAGKPIKVRLKGIIDRLDIKEGKVRVIDYKTGRDAKDFESIDSLIDPENNGRNKAVFQVLFYSYLFLNKYEGEYQQIEPGIFNSRDLFDESFEWKIFNKGIKSPVNEYRQYHEEFEAIISRLLTEIYDPEVSFDQTEDLKKCGYCPYKEICQR